MYVSFISCKSSFFGLTQLMSPVLMLPSAMLRSADPGMFNV